MTKTKKTKKNIFTLTCQRCQTSWSTPEALTKQRLEECLETLTRCPQCGILAPAGLKEIITWKVKRSTN